VLQKGIIATMGIMAIGIALSALLRFTDSDYPFDIFKLFLI
jgi:hypothetical protein